MPVHRQHGAGHPYWVARPHLRGAAGVGMFIIGDAFNTVLMLSNSSGL